MFRGIRVRILLVDDHQLVTTAFSQMLSHFKDKYQYEIVGITEDGQQAVAAATRHLPDIILMDQKMPNMSGLDATYIIKKRHENIRILILTANQSETDAALAKKAGANGYILKDCSLDELVGAIHQVLNHEDLFYSPSVDFSAAKQINDNTLTRRERQVLQLIAENNSSKDIAEMLSLSVRTVEKHRANLKEKLGNPSLSKLFEIAKNMNLT